MGFSHITRTEFPGGLHFGVERPIGAVTAGDCEEFRRWLGTKVGDNTARRHLGRAKQFFRHALRKRFIAENPFADMKGLCVQANRARDHFVDRAAVDKVLESCPDVQWRALFALARYGGLRVPSEVLVLTWDDVDWDRGQMHVRSPKTEHHEGHGERLVPLFPELRSILDSAYHAAPEKSVRVIDRYAEGTTNLATQLSRIIRRAGLTTWPKLWQNLRVSRATELAAEFPAHVAAEWMGHSPAVAAKHYLRVTAADFARATGQAASSPAADASENVASFVATQRRNPSHNEPKRGGTMQTVAGFRNLRINQYPRLESNQRPTV